jgi:hypothetical protein
VPNKLTANVKAAITAAFADAGGVDYLVKVAKTDPRTFCTLLSKLLPTQVTGDAADEPVRVQFSWLAPTQRPSPGAGRVLWHGVSGFNRFQTNPRWRISVREPLADIARWRGGVLAQGSSLRRMPYTFHSS